MRAIFALSVLAILHFSLYPWQFDAARFSSRTLHFDPISTRRDWADVVINLAFYLPPTLAGFWAFATQRNRFPIAAILVSSLTLLSLTVEVLQLAVPTRQGNLRDVLCNFLSSLGGVSLGLILPRPQALLLRAKLPPHALGLAVSLLAWSTWLAFPFLPVLSFYRLINLPQFFLHSSWTLTPMADVFFVLLVLFLTAQHLQLPAFPLAAAASLLIPSQIFLAGLDFSPASFAAALLALLAALTLFRHPSRTHYSTLTLFITLWIVFRQLTPANFAAHPLHSFSWMPFAPLIENDRLATIRQLAGKFLLYASSLWLWCRAAPKLTLASALPVILLVTLTEGLQCFLPGRTPETTEIVLALLAAWLIHSFENPAWRNRQP